MRLRYRPTSNLSCCAFIAISKLPHSSVGRKAVTLRLYRICVPLDNEHGSLTDTVQRVAQRGELLPRASTLKQKTTQGVQPHPHIVVCPSFLFSPVIRIVNVVFSQLPFLYKMEDLSQKENGAERSSLVVLGYSRKEKPSSSLPLLTLGLCS